MLLATSTGEFVMIDQQVFVLTLGENTAQDEAPPVIGTSHFLLRTFLSLHSLKAHPLLFRVPYNRVCSACDKWMVPE